MRVRPVLSITLTAVALAFAAVACSDEPAVTAAPTGGTPSGSTGQTGSPSSEPPWGLDTIDMPDDAQAVEATLGAFPEELEGVQRADVSATEVSYGDGSTFVRAIDLAQAQAEGFPSTVPGYLDLLESSGEVQVEDKELNPNAGFVYLVSTSTAQDSPDADARDTFDAAWGASGGAWLFVASASSPEEREALANAFLGAVSAA